MAPLTPIVTSSLHPMAAVTEQFANKSTRIQSSHKLVNLLKCSDKVCGSSNLYVWFLVHDTICTLSIFRKVRVMVRF